MNLVPADGTAIGNRALKQKLNWSDKTYWDVRNGPVDRGELGLGRGKGGSVRRNNVEIPATTSLANQSNAPPQQNEYDREVELYAPMSKVIRNTWAIDAGFDNVVVQETAQGGGKITGGKWSRPDIAVATLSTYPYVPGKHFDVITFEIKTPEGIDITCVYKALAHLRSATQSYVLLHIPSEKQPDLDPLLFEVFAEAKRHGIGVITAEKPDDYETWDEVVDPVRAEPIPRRLNEFLAKQFSNKQREQIMKWFR